jgi:RecA-family ATPase
MAIAVVETKPVEELPVLRADQLGAQAIDTRLWLIRELWLHQAVGWCAGQPKSAKTFFACEMAISVASGAPCLGHFVVEEPGPVLIYLAEDSLPRIHDRIAAICTHRKIDLATLDLYIITVPRLQLDLPADLARLDATIARIKPQLLLLDCLSRLHARDESSASEMSP